MTGAVATTASVFQLGYSAMLVAVGTAGIFTASWELATVFDVAPANWPAAAVPTMLNQYRFLKSVELGAGLFCLFYRKEILRGTKASAVFLAIVALGVGARSWSWFVDGRPDAPFIAFLVLEACTFAAVGLHLAIPHDRR